MNLLKDFENIDINKFIPLKFRKIYLNLEFFNVLKNRSIFYGKVENFVDKNYRSNDEFDFFKKQKQIDENCLIIAINSSLEKISEEFDDEIFLNNLYRKYNFKPKIIIYLDNYDKLKIKKSKKFYLKSKNALYKFDQRSEYLVIYEINIEFFCNFQN